MGLMEWFNGLSLWLQAIILMKLWLEVAFIVAVLFGRFSRTSEEQGGES